MLKTKRGGLGRGFESLLGEAARDVIAQPEFEALKQIDAAKIRPGIYQPRKVFHDDTLQELAQSIAEHGILQPLVVRPVADSQYEIIAGERRFRASQIAGLTKIPCVVKTTATSRRLPLPSSKTCNAATSTSLKSPAPCNNWYKTSTSPTKKQHNSSAARARLSPTSCACSN